MTLLSLEFATGVGIPSRDDADLECGDDVVMRLGQRASRAVCRRIGAKKLGYMSVLYSVRSD